MADPEESVVLPEFPVEALHVLTFARAIGDVHAAEQVAPPTFTVAAVQADTSYRLRPVPGEPWYGSGREASGYGPDDIDPAEGVLYAEHHFDLVRPVRVGEVLSRSQRPGRRWERDGRRGGRLVFFEEIVEFRDHQGELVVTSTLVGVRTQHRPEGSA